MKSIIRCAQILSLVLSLVACSNGNTNMTSPPSATGNDVVSLNPIMPVPEYPIIDGSSSTVIMHAAIRAYLTDEHFVDPHNQTYEALERLIPGSNNPADVVLAVKYYDDTLNEGGVLSYEGGVIIPKGS